MNPITRALHRIWKMLEIGYAREVYGDLYSVGAISREEYLKLMKEIKKELIVGEEE